MSRFRPCHAVVKMERTGGTKNTVRFVEDRKAYKNRASIIRILHIQKWAVPKDTCSIEVELTFVPLPRQ